MNPPRDPDEDENEGAPPDGGGTEPGEDRADAAPEDQATAPGGPPAGAMSQEMVDAAREEGAKAAASGAGVFANPYVAGDPRRAAWDEGWCRETGSDGMDLPAAFRRRRSHARVTATAAPVGSADPWRPDWRDARRAAAIPRSTPTQRRWRSSSEDWRASSGPAMLRSRSSAPACAVRCSAGSPRSMRPTSSPRSASSRARRRFSPARPAAGRRRFAHHLAARLGIPLVCVGAENLFDKYLGGSEGNVARLFDTLALTEIRAVILLDEIDAIGAKRRDDVGGADSARNSMLTVLLRRVEEFTGVLIAATNRPDALDAALWRRFGMQIGVDLPDDDARFAILKRYGLPFGFDDDLLNDLTDLTAGAAPSLLRQIMEGVKRGLVLGDRLRQPARSPEEAFGSVITQSKPHPDYEPPPLWQNPGLVSRLAGAPWPPARIGG